MKNFKKLIYIFIILISTIFLFNLQDYIKESYFKSEFISTLREDQGKYLDDEIIIENISREEAYELELLLNATLLNYSNYQFGVFKLNERSIVDIISEIDDDLISKINPNYIVESHLPPHLNRFNNQTYIPLINLKDAWNQTKGDGVLVAVIDTGIHTTHDNLKNQISPLSYNATSKQVGLEYINDVQGHGTLVSGIIAASRNSENGYRGIAYESQILVIKCEYNEGFSSADIIQGIYYSADNGADIINMSLGIESNNNPFKNSIQYAVDRGVILVAAAGNSSTRAKTYPASDVNVISVGAVDDNLNLAQYSNFGQFIDVVAPGTAYTTNISGGLSTATGTSMASPMVAGVIALYISKNSNATIDEIKDMLYSTSKDIGNLGRDIYFGYGIIDADKYILTDHVTINYIDFDKNYMQFVAIDRKVYYTPLPSRDLYTFAGWYYDENYEFEFKVNDDIVTGSLTLYSKWDKGYKTNYINEFLYSIDGADVIVDAYIGSSNIVKTHDNITVVNDFAFYGVPNLKYVSLSQNIHTIKERAFSNNSSLSSVTIGANVTNIGEDAFFSNSILTIRCEVSQTLPGWNTNWNPNNQPVLYDYLSITYLVRFYDENGSTLLTSLNVSFGMEANPDTIPTKAKTPQYTYTFSHWNQDTSYITNNLNVSAVYSYELNKYTVTFIDDEMNVLSVQEVYYGSSAVAPDVEPKIIDTYQYTFLNWDKDFSYITKDLTVQAIYEVAIMLMTVRFYDSDGETLLLETNVEYGANAIPPIVLDKYIDDQYSYSHIGWNQDYTNVTSDIDIIAIYEIITNKYTVTFVDEEGINVYDMMIVEYGESAVAPLNPTKEKTAQYTYDFDSWDQDFCYVSSDLVVKAIFNRTLNQYVVTFYNDDLTYLGEVIVNYGNSAEFDLIPTKESTKQYSYTFLEWSADLSYIVEDMVVLAVYQETLNQFQVTFLDEDNNVLEILTVNYGEEAITSNIPDKEKTTQYTFEFVGWDQDLQYIDSDIETRPIFKTTLNKYIVTVIIDGNEIVQEVEYGFDAILDYNITKEGYSFIGYDIEGKNITSDTTITALFTIKVFFVRFMVEDSLYLELTVEYNKSLKNIPEVPEKEGYLAHWDHSNFNNIKNHITVNAVYGQIFHTLIFIVEDEEIKRMVVDGGALLDIPDIPEKEGYIGEWIITDFTNINSDMIIEIIYQKITYTVTFVNYDETIISVISVFYGESASTNVIPKKSATDSHYYIFNGWSMATNEVFDNLTVYATYLEMLNILTVKFIDYNGVVIFETEVKYGDFIEAPTITREDYRFKGWFIENDEYDFSNPIESDLVLTARWIKKLGCNLNFSNAFVIISMYIAYIAIFRRKKII